MIKKIKVILRTINKWFFILLLTPALIWLGVFMVLFCKVESIDKLNDLMNKAEDLAYDIKNKSNSQ